MKIIIDPYRGGNDTGKNINGQYEKNILLNISNYMKDSFSKKGIETELIRTNDVSLTDDERNSIINEIKNNNDIIIQNRISEDGEFNIIYPLRNSDKLASLISNNLEAQDITVDNYYQRRLPTATMLDYYSVIRNTNPNETIIIEYLDATDYEKAIDIIVDSIASYINPTNIYTVKKGDTLYSIANKYNVTVDEIKKLNNLSTNNLSIGMKLSIPIKEESEEVEKETLYTVVKGDTLYSIANKYNVTVDEIKKLNNLSSNNLSIGMKLNIPTKEESEYITTYTVVKGDTLYSIANKYNVTVDEIKKLNNLTSNNLSIGMKLNIPTKEESEAIITYTVVKGDTLYSIANKYNVTVDEIKKLNNLTTNNLSINQILKIPR